MILAGSMEVNAKGNLEIGGCDTVELAKQFGTPLFVMDEEFVRNQCRQYVDALKKHYPKGMILFAGKAFLTLAMARLLHEENMGLDVVSGGELFTALSAEFPAERIYFHGNNKSTRELIDAIKLGVGRIVVDSIPELEEIKGLADQFAEKKVPVLLRVKPGVEAHTHDFIQTGQEDSKFGFGIGDNSAMEAVQFCLQASDAIDLVGLHCHIGSQIFQLEPFSLATQIMVDFLARVREKTGYVARELDLGGGLGIRYKLEDNPPSIERFVENIALTLKSAANRWDYPLPELMLEPGRSITGEAGVTLYTVGVIKDVPGIRRYVSLDGGMMDNIRPALYQAEYEAAISNKITREPEELVTLAGKACESGDILIKDILLPPAESGDIVAIFSTGAYCYSMSSNYNRNPRPAVIFVRNGEPRIVVRRESYEDLIALDVL